MYIRPRKSFLLGLLVVLLGAHLWSIFTSAYFYVWWFDTILHFIGGVFLGSAAIYFLWKYEASTRIMPPLLLFLIIIGLAALGGVLWEFYEFTFDFLFVGHGFAPAQLGVQDTMSDLFFDLLGASFSSILFTRMKRTI